jgi:hypothetical protein
MSAKIYTARVRRILKAMAPADPVRISVKIEKLPPPEERRRIEAENPGERYFWISPLDIKST